MAREVSGTPQVRAAGKADRIEPLEDVAVFAVLWSAAVRLGKPLYVLETGDDTFLACTTTALLLRLGVIVQFGAQFIKVKITHSDPRP
jgi:hypothetical protein